MGDHRPGAAPRGIARLAADVELVVEVALWQRWSGWLVFEGAPFQDERAAYTDLFNAAMFKNDINTYVRLGGTYKF